MLFQMSLCLETNFPKIIKKSIFLLNFQQKLSKCSQNFQQFAVFVQTREKFVNSCEKYVKIMHVSQFSSEIFENFRKFSGVLRTSPTPKDVPPEPKSRERPCTTLAAPMPLQKAKLIQQPKIESKFLCTNKIWF